MRTTLSIDDDVLAAARRLAQREHKTMGQVISALARQALAANDKAMRVVRNGVPLLPRGTNATPVTLEWVNRLRDEQP